MVRPARALLAALVLQIPTLAGVEVNVTRVGFPSVRLGDMVRTSAWTPVIVDLDLVGQPSFDGSLRLFQMDADGDWIVDTVEVHLRSEQGAARRFFLYTMVNPVRGEPRVRLELLNDTGEAVQMVSQGTLTYWAEPAAQPGVMLDDEVLILSVSSGAAGRVQDLVEPSQSRTYLRPIHVAHVSPAELPELWIGLDAVDYVVWDDARPEELSARQLEALLEWVRQGGTLLIAASRSASAIRLTDRLDKAMPVDTSEIVRVANLPQTRSKYLLAPVQDAASPTDIARPINDWHEPALPVPVELVTATLRPGAQVLAKESEPERIVIAQRRFGDGFVIFSAATLRDLFSGPGQAIGLFQKLFDLTLVQSADKSSPHPHSLFEYVAGPIGFIRAAGGYLFAAFSFSVAYLAVATGGVWWFLGRRGWRHHSWSAFALVAVGASALSVLAVKQLHGFGEQLRQISVVDLDAGASYGRASVLFGLKTGSDKLLDVWLPSDPVSASEPAETTTFLRPLAASVQSLEGTSSFADPQSYRMVPGSAVVEDVRIRSTLKRFEGRWEGPLGGTVTGAIRIQGRDISPASTITNKLGVDLSNCYLLQTISDARPVLRRRSNNEYQEGVYLAGARSGVVMAYFLGEIPAGTTFALGPKVAPPPEQLPGRAAPPPSPTLKLKHQNWSERFRNLLNVDFGGTSETGIALGDEQTALLLASTIGDFDHEDPSLGKSVFGEWVWSRDRLRRLDLRCRLNRDNVVLLGFSNDPGPARLFRRGGDRPYRPIEPQEHKSWTMYRVVIPAIVTEASADASNAAAPPS